MHVDKTLKREQTPAMLLGSVTHALLLEPLEVNNLYAVAPKCDRRTNVGKAMWEDFCNSAVGKEVVDAETMIQAIAISKAVRANEVAAELLSGNGCFEKPTFWTCPITGIECRSKADYLTVDYLLDIKTCQRATPEGFAKPAASFGYGRQASWYQWGHEVTTGERLPFVFVAVSTTEPYEVGIYELSENDLSRSRMQNEIDLAELAECMKTGNWNARHESEIVKLSLPKWAEFEDQYQSY